jgi:hypothetical protein
VDEMETSELTLLVLLRGVEEVSGVGSSTEVVKVEGVTLSDFFRDIG